MHHNARMCPVLPSATVIKVNQRIKHIDKKQSRDQNKPFRQQTNYHIYTGVFSPVLLYANKSLLLAR